VAKRFPDGPDIIPVLQDLQGDISLSAVLVSVVRARGVGEEDVSEKLYVRSPLGLWYGAGRWISTEKGARGEKESRAA